MYTVYRSVRWTVNPNGLVCKAHDTNWTTICVFAGVYLRLFFIFRSFCLAFNRFGSNTIALICRSTICVCTEKTYFLSRRSVLWRLKEIQIDPLLSSKVIFSVVSSFFVFFNITKQAKRDQRLNNRKAEQIEIYINVVSSESVVWDHLLMSRIYTNKIKNTAMHA